MKLTLNQIVFQLLFATILIVQPLIQVNLQITPIVSPAHAQDGSTVDQSVPADEQDLLDDQDAPATGELNFDNTDSLLALNSLTNNLNIAPEDQQALLDGKVDVRVTDYLLNLVLPVSYGGQGISHLKVNRILKNYTSTGAGKYDREGVQAVDSGEDVISGHNRGQAVDISEIGDVTCKLVYEHHLGGNTTKWQKPTPVKVAWQSVDGQKSNPTPTAQSILGAAGDMTAQSILAYLNASGEMDYYIDFVKGLDLKTIIGYVGANIYLKTFGVNQVLTDPFADGLLHALGGAVLEKALPGIPAGISSGNADDDARVAFAKSRIEQGLNLPAGSLHGYGWDNILQATGKRHLETSLGLPQGYFDTHAIDDALNLDSVKTMIGHFNRSDSSLNLLTGTIDQFKNKDTNSFKMAGVTVLETALHLPDDQKTTLETAVKGRQTPDGVVLDSSPVGSTINLDDLKNLFSSDRSKQSAVEQSLKTIGLALVTQAAQKATKNKYSGLTASLLKSLLDPKATVKLGDVTENAGASTMGVQVGVNDSGISGGKVNTKQFMAAHAQEIATFLNTEYGLTDPTTQVNTTDVAGLLDKSLKNFGLVEKLGSVQVDKAFGWNKGSTFAVINGKKSLQDATLEIFSNYVGRFLGLKNNGISLEGNIQDNYGYAILADRFGIGQDLLKAANKFNDLDSGKLGDKDARRIFKINSTESLTTLQGSSSFWGDSTNESGWRAMDIAIGTPTGTVESYLRGEITTENLAKQAAQGSLINLSADKIYDFFNISSQYRLDETQINALIKVFRGTDDNTLEDIQTAKQAIYQLLGRSMDDAADFSKDSFFQFIVNPSSKSAVDLLLDQGVRLVSQSLGVNLKNFTPDDIKILVNGIESVFGNKSFADGFKTQTGMSISDAEALRQEYQQLKAIDPAKLTFDQQARLRELTFNGGLQSYIRLYGAAGDILVRATGIPTQFRQDAEAFLRGDWKTGIAAASFEFLLPQINEFMPANDKLTYAQMRTAFVIDDESLIDARVTQLEQSDPGFADPLSPHFENVEALRQEARRQLMEEAQKNIEYRMSDSLLRKIDPTIPVGFSKTMYAGTAAERGALLESFVFAHLDAEFVKLSPYYVPGMLKDLYEGKIPPGDVDKIVLNFIDRSDVSYGAFSNAFVSNFYQFIRASDRSDFYTNTKYQSMWSFFDGWLNQTLDIGSLPSGITKSIYYASQHGWNLDANLKNGDQVIVPSLNSLAKDFLVNKLSSWADKKFGLPVGSVYQLYTLTVALLNADHALAIAHGIGGLVDSLAGLKDGTTLTAAQHNYAQARAALIMFAINLALDACKDCQAFFGSVDQAIAAPPGFTQALLTGLIANALGLGPTGIYIAAAIYLFGAYKVVYLCPTPPADIWGVTSYDSPRDQTDFGVPYSPLHEDVSQISSSPAPGQNPFDWDNGKPFSDGNNPKLWMGWSRYYVGKLLDGTLTYGEDRPSPWKPLQVITYRQANAEYFAPRVVAAFGTSSVGSNQIGLGFSQASTKTSDWVHVGFGGLY